MEINSYLFRSRSCLKLLITICAAVAIINIIKTVTHPSFSHKKLNQVNVLRTGVKIRKRKDSADLKYILLWTPEVSPLDRIVLRGRDPFIKHDCKYTNCYVTHNKIYKNQTAFDAIVFSIKTLNNISIDLPTVRLPKQRYIASSTDLPIGNNLVHPYVDNYFNWTWTFKFDSDILWRNFKIYTKNGQEVGPKPNYKWESINHMALSEEVENILIEKSKAVVWYVTECDYHIDIKNLVWLLKKEFNLNDQDTWTVDILGNCSFAKSCGNETSCYQQIKHDYHFFLAFEKDIYPDYVSDKILIAMQHLTIPLVFGSEMYSSFLPPGSFLDTANTEPHKLVAEMKAIMNDYTTLKRYFSWTNYYDYKSSESEICNICTALNDKKKLDTVNTYKELRQWWNNEDRQYLSDAILSFYETNKSLQKAIHNNKHEEIINLLKCIILKTELEELNINIEGEGLNISNTDVNPQFGEDLITTESIVS